MRVLVVVLVLCLGCCAISVQAENRINNQQRLERMQRIEACLANTQFGDCQRVEWLNFGGVKLRFVHDRITYQVWHYPPPVSGGPALIITRWTSPEFAFYDREPDGELNDAAVLGLRWPEFSKLPRRQQRAYRHEYDVILQVFEQHLMTKPN